MRWVRQSWLRQTKLEISPEGLLCFRPPWRPARDGPDLTSRIPDEILSLILDCLPPALACDPDFACSGEPTDPLAVLFVCKRWRRCYTPILYRRVYISEIPRATRLLETLEGRPMLSNYIKVLHKGAGLSADVLTSIIQRSRFVRELTCSTNMCTEVNSLHQAIGKLEYLDTLRLLSCPSIYTILPHLKQKSLRHLDLSSYGVGRGDELEESQPSNDNTFTEHDAERLLPIAQRYTGTLTSLTISSPAAPPEVTEIIMCWPAALLSFKAEFLSHSHFRHQYNAASMERLLNRQRDTLKDISLGILKIRREQGESGLPDFSSFSSLERLSVSSRNCFAESEVTTLRKLSAPLMHHLQVDFASVDQHKTHVSSFGIDEVTWFKNFALAAKSTDIALKTIFIEFDPDAYIQDEISENDPWPWTYVHDVAQAFAQSGIKLTYSRPCWTIEQWDEEKLQAKILRAHDRGEHQHPKRDLLAATVICRECQYAVEEDRKGERDHELESDDDSSSEECY